MIASSGLIKEQKSINVFVHTIDSQTKYQRINLLTL